MYNKVLLVQYTMSFVANQRVLVLNRNFQPVHITTVRRAFALLYMGAARAMGPDYSLFDFERWAQLDATSAERVIRTVRQSIVVPQVILLTEYERLPQLHIRLSRAHVYARDGYQCQYCGQTPERAQLNLDHVIPRSRGGRTTWDNVVCSCLLCNTRKGARTPGEAGMSLRKTPTRPHWHPPLRLAETLPLAWQPFLQIAPTIVQ